MLPPKDVSKNPDRGRTPQAMDVDLDIPKQRGTVLFDADETFDEDNSVEGVGDKDEFDEIIVFSPFTSSGIEKSASERTPFPAVAVLESNIVANPSMSLFTESDMQLSWESLDRDFMTVGSGPNFNEIRHSSPFQDGISSSSHSKTADVGKAFVPKQHLLTSPTLKPPPGLVRPAVATYPLPPVFYPSGSDSDSEVFDVPEPPPVVRGPPAVAEKSAATSSYFPNTKNPFFRA